MPPVLLSAQVFVNAHVGVPVALGRFRDDAVVGSGVVAARVVFRV
jgi:hypothetical protein